MNIIQNDKSRIKSVSTGRKSNKYADIIYISNSSHVDDAWDAASFPGSGVGNFQFSWGFCRHCLFYRMKYSARNMHKLIPYGPSMQRFLWGKVYSPNNKFFACFDCHSCFMWSTSFFTSPSIYVVPLANLVNFTSESMKAHIFELIVAVIHTFNPVLKF